MYNHGMSQMVDCEMGLESIFAYCWRYCHNACVAHEDIQPVMCEFIDASLY
jgi:hypothetical protein